MIRNGCLLLSLFTLACGPVSIGGEAIGDGPQVTGDTSGGASLSPFITDGQPDGGHPSVGMVRMGGGLCTGTLVGRRTVITAAHCISYGSMRFVAGGASYSAVRAVRHPGYSSNSLSNDIAVLVLDRDVGGIQPTPIAVSPLQVGQKLILVGYGRSSGFSNDAGTKRMGTNKISRLSSTKLWYHGTGGGISGTCNGDSGGPAFILHNGREILAGVTSYGDKYCRQYGVDTRVDAYRSWILQTAGGDVVQQGAGGGGQGPGGGGQGPGKIREGKACNGGGCAQGLTCATVYDGANLKGRYCMETCATLGSDPKCDGAEVCTSYQPGKNVCFAAQRPQSGYTNPGGGSSKPPVIKCGGAEETEALKMINTERLKNGLSSLGCAPAGLKAARDHSLDMCNKGYFSHKSPGGVGVNGRLTKAGARFSSAGENIARGFWKGGGVVKSWNASAAHRDNMRHPRWDRAALGQALCKGQSPIWTLVLLK